MKSALQSTPYRPTFQEGDRVLVSRGNQKIPAVVVEDRGPLGVGSRQIVRVRYSTDLLAPFLESEIPAQELEHDPAGV